jgi:hypothetical protein
LIVEGALWAGEAPKKDADGIAGTWRGTVSAAGGGWQHFIKVTKQGAQYAGVELAYIGMTEEQAQRAMLKQLKPNEFGGRQAICVQQQFAIQWDGKTLAFRGVAVSGCYGGGRYVPDVLVGEMKIPGLLTGEAADTKKKEGRFHLWREGVPEAIRPAPIAAGRTQDLECLDDATSHYTCYLPKAYDPSKEWPVLMNFDPSGNGKSLSTKMAEEVGWIMVGLTESKNGPVQPSNENRDGVLFDLRRRFNINWKRVYFSGLSGGARAASGAGVTYPAMCAGLICIGAAYGQETPSKEIPIFFIAGQTDMNKGEIEGAHRTRKAAGRKTDIIIHPGGHDWGRAEDHEAAIRWLEKETGANPAADTKKKP